MNIASTQPKKHAAPLNQIKPVPAAPKTFVRPKNLAEELAVSLPTLWRMIKRGDLPKPRKLSLNVSAFDRAEIEAWKESREAA